MLADIQVLARLIKGKSKSGNHQQDLENFYGPQADKYDEFRERLLHGRAEMLKALDIQAEHKILELGCGTGRNLHFLEDIVDSLHSAHLVDLCPSLVEIAANRFASKPNVNVVEADATSFQPEHPIDRVYKSYSLTMIPDWQAAVDNAYNMLKPGGKIGIVDFTVHEEEHSFVTRHFWQKWFGHDGVNLNPEHIPYLQDKFETVHCEHHFGKVPYLPISAPYYIFIGQKA